MHHDAYCLAYQLLLFVVSSSLVILHGEPIDFLDEISD